VQLRSPAMHEAVACALLAGPAAIAVTPSVRSNYFPPGSRHTEVTDAIAEDDGDLWVPPGEDSARLDRGRPSPRRPPSAGTMDGSAAAGPSGRLSIRLPRSGAEESGELSGRVGPPTLKMLPSFGSFNSARSGACGGTAATEWGVRIARCRESFLLCLRSSDVTCCSAAVRVLVACLSARLPPDVGRALGIADGDAPGVTGTVGYSEELVSGPLGERSGAIGMSGAIGLSGGFSGGFGGRTGELAATAELSGYTGRGLSPRPSIASSVFSMNSDALIDDLVRVVVNSRMRAAPDDSSRALSDRLASDLSAALLTPLSRPELSGDAVAAVGWALAHLCGGGGGGRLPATAAAALRASAAAQRARLRTQTAGAWADALLPLAHREWPRLLPVTSCGGLRASAPALLQFLTPTAATPSPPKRPLEASAAAAVEALAAVSRACAFAQVLSLCASGIVPDKPPLPPWDGDASTISEGTLVSLTSLKSHNCKVSFKRGEERTALLMVLAPGRPGCASPHAALLAPASSTVSAGQVLSAAPLVATNGAAHPDHRRWMICQVRPTVSMLLESLKAAQRQGLPFGLSAKANQLGDGVWVLSFESASTNSAAVATLSAATIKAREAVAEVLTPLTVAPSGGAL
jgi:hypothetical protein